MRLLPGLISITALLATAPALAAPCTELPTLFLVQDKSGSMAGVPDPVSDPYAPSKWQSSKAVVPQLASDFAAHFRFGVMMYPQTSTTFNCTTGTVLSGVPTTAAGVQAAYDSVGPGGGTPTAASLGAAKSYLQSLGGTAPKHVLLITDGLPNCNLSNDAATCTTTTAGCLNTSTCSGSSCCGLGAKDCLDDQGTVAAAAALKAAGFKVYVVGFGTSVTQANEKTVLDAIAWAGGTGSAYAANNQASLYSALSAIAQSASTCCQNACTQGAAQCLSSGSRQVCQLDASSGCTTWTTQTCPSMSACAGGVCQGCSNACTQGATRCSQGDAQTCQVQASGCTAWVTTRACGYGELCSAGQCNTCQACSLGAARCTASGVETCEWDVLSGCTSWRAGTCAAGSRCSGGSCQSCNQACTAGSKRCAGNTVESCVADAQGCTTWQAGQTCGNFCSGGACGTCGTTCTVGAKRCQGNGVETCTTDQNACTVWTGGSSCAAGTTCTGGACQACATSCQPGAKRCGAGGAIEECRAGAGACQTWAVLGQCKAGEQCSNGACIPPCVDACTLGERRCSGSTPSVCEKAPTGCNVWKTEAACSAGTACVQGSCRAACNGGEFETCPAGAECTGLPEGRFCLPTSSTPPASGGGAGGGGGPSGGAPVTAGINDGPEASKAVSTTSGCASVAAAPGLQALALLGLLLARLARRRR